MTDKHYKERFKKSLEGRIETLLQKARDSPSPERGHYVLQTSRLAKEYFNLTGTYYKTKLK